MRKYILIVFLILPIFSYANTTNLICTHSVTNASIDLIYDDTSSVIKYKSAYADPQNYLYATDVVIQDSSISFNIFYKNGESSRMMLNRLNGTMVIVGREYRNLFTCLKNDTANKLF